MKYGIYFVCSLAAFTSLIHAQFIPIPHRPFGFPYRSGGQSLITWDAFLDLTCPHCKATFPVLQEVADHYGIPILRLNILIFPLPHHRSAWLASQSTHIVNDMNSNATFKWMSDMFFAQEEFYTYNTPNKSDHDIMRMLADVAGNVVDRSTFLSNLENDEGSGNAKHMWKYACSRTISGTPQFLLNGVRVDADHTWTFADWKSIIDPLVGKKNIRKPLKGSSCPQGKTSCEYLPGKVQCCTAEENCIPNVGCRF